MTPPPPVSSGQLRLDVAAELGGQWAGRLEPDLAPTPRRPARPGITVRQIPEEIGIDATGLRPVRKLERESAITKQGATLWRSSR